MNRDAKRLSNNLRNYIDIAKGHILNSRRYFDGEGYVLKTAIKELRQQGEKIIYNRKKDMYLLIREA